jgi:hypothetical protein
MNILASGAIALLAAHVFAASLVVPDTPRIAAAADVACTPLAAIGSRGRTLLERFTVLRERYADWTKRDCYPQAFDDATLAGVERPTGAIIDLNGHAALVVEPDRSWIAGCERGAIVRVVPASGAELLELERQLAGRPELRDLDVLEVGLARGQSASGAPRYALFLGTLQRSLRLQCYDDLAKLSADAGNVFARERDAIDDLYGFLNVELSSGEVGTTRPTASPSH